MTVLLKQRFIINNNFLNALLNIGPITLTARGLGTIFGLIALLQIGPAFIWSDVTGGNLLFGLLTTLVDIFSFVGYNLSSLLDFGLLELFGTISSQVIRGFLSTVIKSVTPYKPCFPLISVPSNEANWYYEK